MSSLSPHPDEKEKAKINSEELQIKKVKKKKKKKHKEGEKHKRVKMYHRSCQTICAGLPLFPPSPISLFKSPLPVYALPNNKTLHVSPASPSLATKCHLNSLPLSFPLSSAKTPQPSPTHHQPQCSYPGMADLEFAHYIHIENQPNGGALVAHAYTSQLSSLSVEQRHKFAEEFVSLAFREDSTQVWHRHSSHYIAAARPPFVKHQYYLIKLLTVFSRQLIMLCPSSTEKPVTCLTSWTTSHPGFHQLQSKWKYWERRT